MTTWRLVSIPNTLVYACGDCRCLVTDADRQLHEQQQHGTPVDAQALLDRVRVRPGTRWRDLDERSTSDVLEVRQVMDEQALCFRGGRFVTIRVDRLLATKADGSPKFYEQVRT